MTSLKPPALDPLVPNFLEPVPNTLENVLALFPLTSQGRSGHKRKREVMEEQIEREEQNFLQEPQAPTTILFPTPEQSFALTFDRLQLPQPRKKRRTYNLSRVQATINQALQDAKIQKPTSTKKPKKKSDKKSRVPLHQLLPPSTKPPLLIPPPRLFCAPNHYGVKVHQPYELFAYQRQCVDWLLARERGQVTSEYYEAGLTGGILAAEMGTGKTFMSGTLIMQSLCEQRDQKSCTLYVCPTHLFSTVCYELDKFFGSQLRVQIFHRVFLGVKYKRWQRQDIGQYDVLITSYKTLAKRLEKNPQDPVITFPWYRILLDESHEIRTAKTCNFKTMCQLVSPRRWCLTGTPYHNSIKDVFNQLRFCGLRLPPRTKTTVANFKNLGLEAWIKFQPLNNDLPEKTVIREYYDLSPREKDIHSYLLTHSRRQFKINNQTTIFYTNLNLMMHFCTAPHLLTKNATKIVFPENLQVETWMQNRVGAAGYGSSKLNRTVTLLQKISQDDPQSKVVIFANHTTSLRLLIERLTQEGMGSHCVYVDGLMNLKKRDVLFTEFRTQPHRSWLFMTLKLGSSGLNLTEANTVIFLEPWYSYAALAQGEGRVHRTGQIKPVTVYYLLGKETVEEQIYRIAMDKKKLANDLASDNRYKLTLEEMERVLEQAMEDTTHNEQEEEKS